MADALNLTDGMRLSMDMVEKHQAVIKRLIGCSEISRVEGDDHEVLLMLDRTCGVDYYATNTDGLTFAVASRFQRTTEKSPTPWDTFTIRAERISGAKTEFEKRKQAIERGAEYPHLTMHGYVDQSGNLLSMAIAKTSDIFDCIDKGYYSENHTGSAQKGQASFYVVWWNEMKKRGYHINTYKVGGVA